MSVIVAIKENGVVYMGADAQTTTGSFKSVSTSSASVKINKLKGGLFHITSDRCVFNVTDTEHRKSLQRLASATFVLCAAGLAVASRILIQYPTLLCALISTLETFSFKKASPTDTQEQSCVSFFDNQPFFTRSAPLVGTGVLDRPI